MSLLIGFDEAVADWVSKKPYGKPFQPPYTAFGIVDEAGHLRGGFVFTGYTGQSIQMSLATDKWRWRLREWRGAWGAIINYVFDQRECSRLEVRTAASNKIAKKQIPRIGFVYEGPARRLYGDEGGFQYSLTVDDLPAFKARWRL